MMKLQFEFDNVSSSGDLKDKIKAKFSSLEKYLTHINDDFHKGIVRIIKGERWGYKVKVEVSLPGKDIVAESKDASLMNAIDQAYEKSARITRKYLDKLKDKKHK